jgi:SAM-dependent methyltransferase
MIDLRSIATNLEPGEDGIWFARERAGISYPEEGNQNCLAVEENSFWFEHRNRCITQLMRAFPPPGVVFDVGGGNGYVALGMKQAGIAAIVVEPGQQGAQNARRRGIEPVVCAALEDAGFLPESLPAVGIFDVLEHMQDEAAFLGQLRGLLAEGGRLYLTVPSGPLLWSADDEYAGHYRRYTLTSLRAALGTAGFEVEFATSIFTALPPMIWLRRSLPSRMGLLKPNNWKRYQREIGRQPGWIMALLRPFLDAEIRAIRQMKQVRVGGSCLAVARKK